MLAALDELLVSDFIRPTETPRRFRFRHPIVRRAVYDGIPQGWQIGAHARAAAALEAAHAPAGARAHHVESSATVGDERAISLLVQAGRDAAPRAPEAAGRWLLAAARLLPPTADGDERRLELLGEAATALTYAGAYDEALEVLDTVNGLLPPERVDERAGLVARIAFARRMNGRSVPSPGRSSRRTLKTLAPDSAGALGLTLELALDHYWRGEFGSMYDVARDVADRARGGGEALVLGLGRGAVQPGQQLARVGPAWGSSSSARPRSPTTRYPTTSSPSTSTSAVTSRRPPLRSSAPTTRSRTCGGSCGSRRQTGQSPLIPGLLVLEANALVMKGRIAEAMAVPRAPPTPPC